MRSTPTTVQNTCSKATQSLETRVSTSPSRVPMSGCLLPLKLRMLSQVQLYIPCRTAPAVLVREALEATIEGHRERNTVQQQLREELLDCRWS